MDTEAPVGVVEFERLAARPSRVLTLTRLTPCSPLAFSTARTLGHDPIRRTSVAV